MYSQNRPNGNNFGESEHAYFKREWRQDKTKICDEEYMLVSRTEKHQNDVKASPKLQSFNYPYSSTSLDRRIEKGITNGYENVCHSGENGSADSTGDENGLVSDNNHYVSFEFSSDIYENDGDDFLSDNKHQPWMDNIIGGTSRKEYIDKNLYRPTLQHDSSNSLQNARRIGFIENRSVETETQNLDQNEKRNDIKTNKTGLVVILSILLIACIAGVLAWFLAKKGDDEFSVKYYVVIGEMALTNEFYPVLSNSSTKEFKDLALQFCGAVTDALGKNNTEYGDLYRHCDVKEFKNGSIIVQYRLYYLYYEIQITKEKVYQDLKNSLTDIDSGLANFSVFVIRKASVSFLVEVQTFKTDPFAIDAHLITSTTITAATEQETTAISSNSTTMDTTEYPKVSTTLTTSDYPTTSTNTVERFAESTTMNKTERSTLSTTIHTTESSPTPTNLETSERITSTTFSATATTIEYSADVVFSPMIAIYGETTTTKTCVVSPRGDWFHVTVTVENQGISYVIGKYYSNKSFEEPTSLERFNASISSTDTEIVVYLTMDLQAPTIDMCSWNRKYAFLCSITMNDSMTTRVYNGSRISITAPPGVVTIDSNVHYNEGDKMTFNCSVKGDPNYSTAYLKLIKNSQILYTIPGPMFGSDYISNCSAVLNWSGGFPNPLTTHEHDLIVRCVVQNKLLNETRNSEKKLNVSAADVAFNKYSYKALTSSHQEIECIARSPMSILQELIISKDDVQIATLNSSGVASSTDGRYSTNKQEYDGEVRLTLSISSVVCQDQGQYNCKLITKNDATRVSPKMTFIVEGSKPTMVLHPDIYEPFARRGFNHVCSTEHVGDKNNDNFLEIQIFKPGSQRAFTYSEKIAEVEKMFDSTNNITFINITGTTAQFLLVSDTSSSSNLSCNIKDTITFLLDLTMEFDNGSIKCVLKDEMEEFSSVESTITVIPGNFCDGYEDGAYRKHPNNECSDYINCIKIGGKMYAVGNQCPLGQCIQFATRYCVPCDSTFTCDTLTTPGPTTTTTTLPTGRRYVSCNDSAHFLGTTAAIKCVILDTSFDSLNITFLPEQSQNEEYVGELFPDGQVQSLPQSPVVISANFDSSPKILMFTFQLLECSSRGRYRIIAGDTNSSVAPSVETFELNVLDPPKHEAVNLTINPDIKENKYEASNVHTCSGDIGYPVGLGYLSLRFTDPTTNASFTHDKMSVTDDMKTSLNPPLKFQVNLATGLSIIIVEDKEPDDVNCTRKKEIKFLLQATSYWNKAKIRCRVISEVGEVNATAAEEEIYVIPDSICDGSNGSDVYRPHEKMDGCKTYVRCFHNVPTGKLCQPNLCFDHQINNCIWCTPFMCESELIPTTEELTTVTMTTSPPAVEVTQCPILSCNSTSVYDMETAHIVCDMNTSATYDNITVIKNGQPLMTAYPNGTNHYYSNGTNKYEGTLEMSFTFTIKDVLCSDKNDYTFTVEDGGREICSQTSLLVIKAKPTKPKLVIDYKWTEGTNLGTHLCTGNIGNPLGTMTLEIRNGETGNFTSFSPSTKHLLDKMENCNNNATLSFSIDFNTETIQGYHIRCVADNQFTLSSSESPFYSDSVLINPLPRNACFIDGIKPYPGDCSRFLICSNNNTNVLKCAAGSCFEGTLSTCVTNNCTSICNS